MGGHKLLSPAGGVGAVAKRRMHAHLKEVAATQLQL